MGALSDITEYSVSAGTTNVESLAFRKCRRLSRVTLLDGLLSILFRGIPKMIEADIFVNAVVKTKGIPFSIKAAKEDTPSALNLFMQQRRAA